MSTTCAVCGQRVAANAAFCVNCGRPVPRACSTCGAPVDAGDKWCINCGSKVAALAAPAGVPAPQRPAAASPAQPPAGPRRRGRPQLPVLLAVVAIVALAAGGFIVLHPGSSPSGAAPIVDGFPDPLALTLPGSPAGSLPPVSETKPITGQLTVGKATALATQTIGASGGTIAAEGLKIEVPDGTLADDAAFDVKQAPITDSTFGGFVTPITPLYLIDDGEATFDKPVTVEMAATIPEGSTAMGFSYDDASGTLTPLMPIAQDATSLTVAATHFSPVFGGLVDVADESAPIDSGFRPGTDDWQFKNYGAYVAPVGICEGMNLGAVWYYVHQHRGADAPPLHGRSDNNGATPKTPDFWQDDSNAYRFAASIQASPVGDWPMYRHLSQFQGIGVGKSNYEAVRAAIKATGEPQLMWIDTDARDAAHSLIVVEVEANRLLVSDPNYPGPLNNPRWIPYDPATGKLGPYSSGKSSADIAANGVRIYTRFAYIPRATAAADAVIAARWAEFQAKTAGNSVFPKYDLEVLTGTNAQGQEVWAPLADGYRTSDEKLTVRLKGPQANTNAMLRLYRGTGIAPATPGGRRATIQLTTGANPLGILEEARPNANSAWAYVNFVRLTVNLEPSEPASPSAAVAGGQWVLTSTDHRGLPDPSAYGFSSSNLTVDSSNGGITGSYKTADQQMSGSASWGPPPATASPGDKWTTTLSASGSCTGVSDGVPLAGVTIKVSWWEGSTRPQEHDWGVSASCGGSPGSEALSWEFPAHVDGPCDGGPCAIEIVEVGNAGFRATEDSWTYHYEWKP